MTSLSTRFGRLTWIFLWTLALTLPIAARADLPPDDSLETALTKLVPDDACITITLTDLRGHFDDFLKSDLANAFWKLPVVEAWQKGDRGAEFKKARVDIEKSLGTTFKAIRDDLVGDAVVLTLHLPKNASPADARGLLLVKARDQQLLAKLIDLANQGDGALREVKDESQGPHRYKVRHFKPGELREDEYYRIFDDGTFAWSNSKSVLLGVLARKALPTKDRHSLDPLYARVRQGLPTRAMATIVVLPRLIEQVLAAAPKPENPGDDKAAEIITRYLKIVEGIGLAVELKDGLVLHTHELINPQSIDPRLRRWAKSSQNTDTLTRRIPSTALAAATMPIDFESAYDALTDLVAEAERPRLGSILSIIQGVALGRDVRKELIPRVGPAVLAYVEEPGKSWPRFPIVGVIELRDDGLNPSLPKSIDNAIHTLIALYSLDPKHQPTRFILTSRQSGPLKVTSLADPLIPFAYAVGPDCFVVGTSADAVARFGESDNQNRLAPFKSKHFRDSKAFAAVDLNRLVKVAQTHRDDLIKKYANSRNIDIKAATTDIDQALGLLDLFGGAYFAIQVDPQLTSVHQMLGLVAR